jgi:alanyl-tRNA synthetase
MNAVTSTEIRASFLKFFEDHGHRVVSSSSLVPGDDPTLLFTNAGMNQFKDVFLGRDRREYARAATAQKCMRVSGKHNDLENVGPSLRHHTFFEMLGNFSFGDYFKDDAIAFAWTLLTEVWRMQPDRLVVSIFKGEHGIPRDDEAYNLWRRFVAADRIIEFGADDNFWQMGDTGPCGRCSEIYVTRAGTLEPEIEIWNNVFMEFNRGDDGVLRPLPAPSIDTGMGLERMTAVLQGKASNYDTDVFAPVLTSLGALTRTRYGHDPHRDVSMRVVADHIRATTFLIADGVVPSNEKRGYVLRKIMRRAMRHGKLLGLTEPFLHRLVAVLSGTMGDAYPELRREQALIERTILAEEHRFDLVLTEGLPRLEAEIAKALESPARVLPGEAAFRLYDTFGVPYDFIEDTAASRGVAIDEAGYQAAMEGQRGKARAQSAFGGRKQDDFAIADEGALAQVGDVFEGYTTTTINGVPVVALFDEQRRSIDQIAAGGRGFALLARTPFYLESGGQVSDVGRIASESTGTLAIVEGVVRTRPGLPRAHHVHVTAGTLRVRDLVTADVDAVARDRTRRSHTATHLLHAALRRTLGSHVKQAGSLVAPDRLRFDFVHFQALTRAELDAIERIVNQEIVRNVAVETAERSTAEAVAAGAMALFGEKYGDRVRVVSVPGFSMELCGGTHVRATGDIGFFAITAESGVAAGTRRIEAVTGDGAVAWAQAERARLAGLLDTLRVGPEQAVEAVERLQGEARRLAREVTQLKAKAALGSGPLESPDRDVAEIGGVRVVRRRVEGLDKDALRTLTDSLKSGLKSGVVILVATAEDKVQLVAGVTADLTDRIKAGQIVKELAPIVGGRGGGRPDFAEAGGRDVAKVDELLAASETILARLLG